MRYQRDQAVVFGWFEFPEQTLAPSLDPAFEFWDPQPSARRGAFETDPHRQLRLCALLPAIGCSAEKRRDGWSLACTIER